MYYLECVLEMGSIVRMNFASKQKAEFARRKIAKEMAKGRFTNGDGLVEVKSDNSSYSLLPNRIQSVSVNDEDGWMKVQADTVAKARELGIPVQGDK